MLERLGLSTQLSAAEGASGKNADIFAADESSMSENFSFSDLLREKVENGAADGFHRTIRHNVADAERIKIHKQYRGG